MKLPSFFSDRKPPSGERGSDYPDLILAVWRNDLRQLEKLSTKPDVLDPDGRTALMAAAIDAKPNAARVLIDAGADVDIQDPGGWSALHFAAQSGSSEIARMLLEAGASVDAVDSHGNTPLFRATFESRGNGDLIELLRSYGADPTASNHSGISPVQLARTIANYDVAQFYEDVPD